MEISELFKGIAVVIDDEVDIKGANISKVLKQLDKKNIPYISYKDIPSDEIISNFQNLSFILLDWDLKQNGAINDTLPQEVKIQSTLKKLDLEKNIEFIEKVKRICFCPIFIFSNYEIVDIQKTLEDNKLIRNNSQSHIFIKRKSDLINGNHLFSEIESWVKDNPSIYVLKKWENEYQRSKNSLFLDFQEINPLWPRIIWSNFEKDGVNKSSELGKLIHNNLNSRMYPLEFSEKVLSLQESELEPDSIRKVLEGELYLKDSVIPKDSISPGDLFQRSSDYFLNIRASCDLVPNRNSGKTTINDVELYLIIGKEMKAKEMGKKYEVDYGLFRECTNQVIVFPINNGKAIVFNLKKLRIDIWANFQNNRIGRILPPHITRIQQKYSFYLQRQGLPRIPLKAIS